MKTYRNVFALALLACGLPLSQGYAQSAVAVAPSAPGPSTGLPPVAPPLAVPPGAQGAVAPTTAAARPMAPPPAVESAVRQGLVTLDVTYQEWAWEAPWRKKSPSTRTGGGLVLPDGRVLTCAGLVAGATLVELHRGSEQAPWPGRVELVDPASGLALVSAADAVFGNGLAPLPLTDHLPAAGETANVSVYRYRSSRKLDAFPGTVVDVDTSEPGMGGTQLLTAGVNVQMDGGGQCEAVLQQGRLLGLAYAKWGDKLSVLAAPVLRAWVADAAAGQGRKGFAAPGWRMEPLTNPVLRTQLGVPAGREGVLLNRVWAYASGAGALQDGDVLLSLAGREIDARGQFAHPVYGPQKLGLLLTEGRLAGDTVPAEVVRDGAVRTVDIALKPDAPHQRTIPNASRHQPRYLVFGGLVFQELSLPYLRAFGENPPLRLAIQADLEGAAAREDRQRYVVLTQVLPDASTVGYESVRNRLVNAVNGQSVRTLEEVAQALEQPVGGFCTVSFLESRERVVLDARTLPEAQTRILQAYQIEPARRLEQGW